MPGRAVGESSLDVVSPRGGPVGERLDVDATAGVGQPDITAQQWRKMLENYNTNCLGVGFFGVFFVYFLLPLALLFLLFGFLWCLTPSQS